jgi:WD40 repeat protein
MIRILPVTLVLLIVGEVHAAPVTKPKGHTGAITAVAFSPKGDRLLSVGTDGWALVWDVKTERVIYHCPQQDEELLAAVWRPDGKQFAVAGEFGVVRVWEIDGEKPVAEYKGHKGPVLALAFTPDGKFLASGGYMRTIRFWPARADEFLLFGGVLKDMDGRVTSLVFTEDGKSLVVGTAELTELRINDEAYNRSGEGGFVRVYDVRTGELTKKLDVRGSQIAVAGDRVLAAGIVLSEKAVIEKGERVVNSGGGPVLSIADLKTGKSLAATDGIGLAVAWSKDGAVVVSGGQSYRHYPGNIMLSSKGLNPPGAAISTGLGKNDKLTSVAVDPRERGSNNVFRGDPPPLTVRDAKTLKELEAIDDKDVESLAVSPDGKLIAVGGSNGLLQLYQTPMTKK